MLRHVVLLKWKPETTAEQIAAATAALRELPSIIEPLRKYTVGSDLELGEGRWNFGIVADFDDAAGWLVYDQHPDHNAARADLLAPIVAERASIQFAF